MSGHIFFNDRWYGFDDALYTGARLLEILSRVSDPTAQLHALPNALCTPELHVLCEEGENFDVIASLQKMTTHFKTAQQIITIDGLRVEYAKGFGLVRASNTTPVLVMRFEADDEMTLQHIQHDFRTALLAVKADAKLPF